MARLRFPVWLVGVLLVLVTIGVYWPATRYDFINYDDPTFVTSNAHVQGGLNWGSVKWAFRLNEGDYWHPLTWLSLMLDASLFGPAARGFHFTSVAFHAANGVLLFLLLRLLTGAFWRSVCGAALFALHPLRVESVAWVTERKDVLSGFFGLLALIFYARYATCGPRAKGGGQRLKVCGRSSISHAGFLGAYWFALLFLACGLMSKAMLVTWPFVMLLLELLALATPSTCTQQAEILRSKVSSFLLPSSSFAA